MHENVVFNMMASILSKVYAKIEYLDNDRREIFTYVSGNPELIGTEHAPVNNEREYVL